MAKERWITVNGNHILIKDEQSVNDYFKEKKTKKRLNKGKYEYLGEDGKTWEDMDEDSYNELEADEEEFDPITDEDYEDARPNETKLNDMDLSDSDKWNMAYKYIGTDKLEKLAEQLDLDSPQDIPTSELIKYMSDDEIADMMRVNGLDEEEPNPMDEFSGPDQEGPSYAQLDAMIKDLRKDYSDEDIIKKLAMMFKGTIK